MKKISTIILLLSIGLVGFAQVPLTVSYNTNDVTNQNINLRTDETMYFPISNNGATDMNVTVEITDITIPHKAPAMNVCWENCYSPTGPMSIGTRIIAAGENSGNNFDIIYIPDNNTNPANITFHIYEEGNSLDFITLTLDTETVGIKEINQKNLFSIYPNPATKFFTVKTSENVQNSEIIISNILGKTLSKIQINTAVTSFKTDNFSPGLYFVSIISNGIIIDTKKLIIKQ